MDRPADILLREQTLARALKAALSRLGRSAQVFTRDSSSGEVETIVIVNGKRMRLDLQACAPESDDQIDSYIEHMASIVL